MKTFGNKRSTLYGKAVFALASFLVVSSCGPSEMESRMKSAWDGWNDPTILEEMGIGEMSKFSTKLDELPVSGSLDLAGIWSDDYWPTFQGGISHRWSYPGWKSQDKSAYNLLSRDEVVNASKEVLNYLSPSEKYDVLQNDYDFSLTKFERQRTGVLKTFRERPEFEEDYDIPTWEGLCHGWAPATIEFAEPHPVSYKNAEGIEIKMYSSDIKALLTFMYHYQSPKSTILGKRCNEDPPEEMDALYYRVENGEISIEEYKSQIKEEYDSGKIDFNKYIALLGEARSVESCQDSNAGAFHIVLANQIGRMNQGFVIDVTREAEVWNQGVVSYEFNEIARYEGEEISKYAAAGTAQEVEYKTVIYYISEVAPHKSPEDYEKARAVTSAEFNYKVELDGDGQIIGGSWLSYDRPDFLWKQDRPKFEGYFEKLGKIYDLSISDYRNLRLN